MNVTKVEHNGQLLAIIVPSEYSESGVHFFTDHSYSQQLAYMGHPTGKVIEPHVHNSVERQVFYTQEVLLIRKGKLRVDFYTNEREYIESRILSSGDIILLASGGHGFEVLEEIEMVEVKQGPYSGEMDKTRFEGVAPEELNIVHQR